MIYIVNKLSLLYNYPNQQFNAQNKNYDKLAVKKYTINNGNRNHCV